MIFKKFYSRLFWFWVLVAVSAIAPLDSFSQCNALSSRRDIFFTPTFGCAPTAVTRFEITYYFTLPQNPAGIQIRYTWNDPGGNVTTADLASGTLVVGAGNTSFSANATFLYTSNNGQCSIRPQVSIIVNGTICPTSTQAQTAPYWGTDDQANGKIAMAPNTWDVCYNNPVINATFSDASDFNCNIAIEADNPNRLTRHVQFVYGTNNVAASSIRDLTLVDGGTRNLTDGTGAVVTPVTRGTAGLLVTGAYFGPVDNLPFPADNPTSVSFPMNAPANAANLIGNRFEITLFNWNVCNPWNGDPVNPNYEDARMTTGYIQIVAAPAPAFDTRDGSGNPKSSFCINETIHLNNQTPSINTYTYTWNYYDDAAGTVLLGTSHAKNPTYQYATGGVKLIRLIAANPTAQGSCNATVEKTVNIVPTVVAKIGVTDLSDVPITPWFCQETSAPFTTFQVRFHDNSTGTPIATSLWRWEFRDQTGALYMEQPGPGTFSSTVLGPFDLPFVTPGIYKTKLITKDLTTGCATEDVAEVRVYQKPAASFTATAACAGDSTLFKATTSAVSINGETIIAREWDFNYNGSVFNPDPAYTNKIIFKRPMGAAATYNVALRVTMDQNGCDQTVVVPVTVNPLPLATFTSDVVSGCSVLSVTFTNTSVASQPSPIDTYVWEVDEKQGSGFLPVATQHPTDPGFNGTYQRDFKNILNSNVQFDVRLRTTSLSGCQTVSAIKTITVFPGTASGFIALNYSPFSDNCSPEQVNFTADGPTQSLNPSDYTWTVSDVNGVISTASSGTVPTYSYQFINTTQSVKDFQIKLRTSLTSGCFGDSSKTIRISPVPSGDFKIDTLGFDCLKMRVRMTATQKGMDNYHWQILENGVPVSGASGVSDTLGYLFDRPAAGTADINVQIILDARNFANCTSPPTTHAFVVPQQNSSIAAFTASPVSQSLPNSTVTITNTSTGPGQYLWDFGDTTTSVTSATSFTHTYSSYGTYVIKLSLTDGICVRTQSASVTILAIPPLVDFDYAPPFGCIPLTVVFTNLSKYADPTTYHWDFGDGFGTSREANPSYTYFNPGKYTVSLSASNSTGQVIKNTKLLIIEAYPRPEAGFKIRPDVVYIPDDIMYTSNLSLGGETYLWDFGDGTTSEDPEPHHQYTKEGSYTITLVASNKYGCADTSRLNNAVKAQKGGEILIPNGFTPNVSDGGPGGTSNGKNDIFLPIARNVTSFELLIFNRWGELLFKSNDQNVGWDGYYNGRLCQQDVYAYKLTTTSENGVLQVKIGDVTLIR